MANGADAVYLGLGALNARRGAENFTPRTLEEACRHAHLADARVYLTANTIVLADEMDGALDLVAGAWEAGIDAVIVQDLGLMALLRDCMPEVRVHASTQVNAHDSAMLEVLAQLGCARVTLAREVSLPDIERFCARPSGPEVEVFVHGSLCYCYSGQCLMSSMIGARSANRGLCAQPCRLPYKLLGGSDDPVEIPGDYLMSTRDLAGIGRLGELVRAGVSSLKIEGRMKAPEYVALVTGVYRRALDRAIADPDTFAVTEAEMDILEEAFNRGFTDGYLTGRPGQSMMSYQRPNNRGVGLGRVASVVGRTATVALDRALSPGDRIEFWTRSGRFSQLAGAIAIGVDPVAHAEAGARASIAVVDPVRVGDRVFRVANADLLSAARRTLVAGRSKTVPVGLVARIRVGEPLTLTASANGHTVTVSGPVVEAARTRPVTATDAAEHIGGRLGGSGYRADGVELDLDADAGLGFSQLHAIRRLALERLDEARLARWTGRTIERPALSPPAVSTPQARRAGDAPRLVVICGEEALAGDLAAAGASEVFVDERLLAGGARLADGLTGHLQVEFGAFLPRSVTEAHLDEVLDAARASGRAIAGNLGVLAASAAAGVRVEADAGLNAANPWTVSVLADLGASRVWVSHELSASQVAAMARLSLAELGVSVFGRTELMVAENCVLAATGPCSRRCERCARRATQWRLRDRKGYEFPVRTDVDGRSHIFNSVTTDLSRELPSLIEAGIGAIMADVRLLLPAEARRIVTSLRDRVERAAAGKALPREGLVTPSTSGHYFRGVR